MKKLFLILLCFPMIGFGQVSGDIKMLNNYKYIVINIISGRFNIFPKKQISRILDDAGYNIVLSKEISRKSIFPDDLIKNPNLGLYLTTKGEISLSGRTVSMFLYDYNGNLIWKSERTKSFSGKAIELNLAELTIFKYKYDPTGINNRLVNSVVKNEKQSTYEILKELADLKKEGILSEEEFNIEKTKILSKSNNSNAKAEVEITKKKSSFVDINIPSNKNMKDRYALVIGNEDYESKQRGLSEEQNVEYAVNDAKVFKDYALKTLGVKQENMFFLTDASAVEMNREITKVSKIIKKIGNKAELIVYYAGHGLPDENTKVPYLIPVDVSASDLLYAVKLDDFYKDLASTGAKRITVFLDACFTGGGRVSGLLAARGVKMKPKEGVLDGNLVVFSASSEEQSALPYHKEGHGMFTYHLLKKLQESKGKVSMGELADYIKDQVSIQSLKTNEKEQDPTVNTSPKVQETWRDWEF